MESGSESAETETHLRGWKRIKEDKRGPSPSLIHSIISRTSSGSDLIRRSSEEQEEWILLLSLFCSSVCSLFMYKVRFCMLIIINNYNKLCLYCQCFCFQVRPDPTLRDVCVRVPGRTSSDCRTSTRLKFIQPARPVTKWKSCKNKRIKTFTAGM